MGWLKPSGVGAVRPFAWRLGLAASDWPPVKREHRAQHRHTARSRGTHTGSLPRVPWSASDPGRDSLGVTAAEHRFVRSSCHRGDDEREGATVGARNRCGMRISGGFCELIFDALANAICGGQEEGEQ